MKRIMLIPLDERPCNYDFPYLLSGGTDIELIRPPLAILAQKKTPGDINAIAEWVRDNAGQCYGAIVAVDTLVYSSILASRLHHDDIDVLLGRLNLLREIKAINPQILLYCYSLIMRNPAFSSSDEEPDYYADFGREIHRYGVCSHKQELGIANPQEQAELDDIMARLPQEYLDDYLNRRCKNIEVNKQVLRLTHDGIIDFLIIPQDDSSPYGLTAKDQQLLRTEIQAQRIALRAYMYPDADAVANSLLARMACECRKKPLIYINHASTLGALQTPLYEDRTVTETIKYQIMAAGGLVATSAAEADIILMENMPSGNQQGHDPFSPMAEAIIEYDVNRNQIEQVEYARYAIEQGKAVCFADIAYANGGDPALYSLLSEAHLVYRVAGYAGWNTSSNTLGTAIPQAILFLLYGDRAEHRNFLALRYLEDIGYMTMVRCIVTTKLADMGYNYFSVDGARGTVAKMVEDELNKVIRTWFTDEYATIVIDDCCLPWSRMFEAGLRCHCEAVQKK